MSAPKFVVGPCKAKQANSRTCGIKLDDAQMYYLFTKKKIIKE